MNLREFVAQGGTLITLGAASDLAIEKFGVPVKNLKAGLTRDQHFAPGTILKVEVDTTYPLGYGMSPETYGFYNNSPFFSLVEGFSSQKTTDRRPLSQRRDRRLRLAEGRRADVWACGGRVGRDESRTVVLFGLRPQHRAQTHATFPMLFNALYLAAEKKGTVAFSTSPTGQ